MRAMVQVATPSALKPGTKASRALTLSRDAINVDARTCELAFASETPYERWWGVEILDLAPSSVRLERMTDGAGPVLWNHNTDEQIGVVESVSIGKDRVARAVVRFGRSAKAEEVWRDVQDGVIRNVSVGYLIHKAVLTETGDEGPDTYRVTDWEPYEISPVSVPADPTVGVGRSAENNDDPRIKPAAVETVSPTTPITETRTMTGTATPEAPALNTSEVAAQARKEELARIAELRAIGDEFKKYEAVKDIVKKALDDGSTVDNVRKLVMNAITAAQKTEVPHLDLSQADTRRFSVMGAIRAMVEKDWSSAGFERECHSEILKRLGLESSPHGGIFIPADIQRRDLRTRQPAEKRDLTVGTNSAGGYLVGTDLKPASFIDLLRARSVGGRVGVTYLAGLVGNVAIPKQSGAATAYWLTNEATAITESAMTFGQLSLTPKTLGCFSEISRLLQLQSTPSVDALVMNDFAKVMALKIDLAMLEGDGTGGAPTGIASTSGIGSVTGTSLAIDDIVEFQTDVAGGNALDMGSAYVTTPTVAGLLMQRQRFSSTDTPLWVGSVLEGQVMGFLGTTTTQMTAASMIFGDYSQVVIGEWGFLELALNPYSQFSAGISAIRAMQTVDVGIRQAGAFSRATSIT